MTGDRYRWACRLVFAWAAAAAIWGLSLVDPGEGHTQVIAPQTGALAILAVVAALEPSFRDRRPGPGAGEAIQSALRFWLPPAALVLARFLGLPLALQVACAAGTLLALAGSASPASGGDPPAPSRYRSGSHRGPLPAEDAVPPALQSPRRRLTGAMLDSAPMSAIQVERDLPQASVPGTIVRGQA